MKTFNLHGIANSRRAVRLENSAGSNCAQRSVATVDGASNEEIQCVTKVRAMVSACISGMGIAVGQRVKRSITVNRYRKPLDGGNGPTMSICR